MHVLIDMTRGSCAATFDVTNHNEVTIVTAGLSGSEQIKIQIEYLPGLYMDHLVCTASAPAQTISAPGKYKVLKPFTSTSTSVAAHTSQNLTVSESDEVMLNVTQSIDATVRSVQDFTVHWGDGTSTDYIGAGASNIEIAHTYVVPGVYKITGLSTCAYFEITTDNAMTWRTFRLPPGLTYLSCRNTDSALIGNVAELPHTMTHLVCYNTDSALIGNVVELPPGLTWLSCSNTDSALAGNVAELPPGLTYLSCSNTDSALAGNVAELPPGLTYLSCSNTQSIVNMYTPGRVWAHMTRLSIDTVSPGGLDSTAVDNLLIDLADTTWASSGVITLLGSNAGRTSASDEAVVDLINMGVSVTTN